MEGIIRNPRRIAIPSDTQHILRIGKDFACSFVNIDPEQASVICLFMPPQLVGVRLGSVVNKQRAGGDGNAWGWRRRFGDATGSRGLVP